MALAAWTLLLFAALQVYVAYALLVPRPDQARGSLAALFILNAVTTWAYLSGTLGVASPWWPPWADVFSNGLLVGAAELAAARIEERRPRLLAGGLALATVIGPFASAPFGVSGSPWLLAAYAFALLQLGTAWRRARSDIAAAWAGWLLVAFAPRAVEFLGAFPNLAASPLDRSALMVGLALDGVAALSVVATAVLHRRPLRDLVVVAVLAGALLGAVRFFGASEEPLVVFLSLGGIRPAAVAAGILASGLLGAEKPGRSAARHALIIAGAAGVFLALHATLPSLLLAPSLPVVLGLSAALAVMSLPLWVFLGKRMVARQPSDHRLELPTIQPDLDPDQRLALAALTRNERVLLALRGSSRASLGDPTFAQVGLTSATDIPGKHLAAVVRTVNQRSSRGPLIGHTTGTRGARHYWLTETGASVAEDLASRLRLGEPGEARSVLGERWYR